MTRPRPDAERLVERIGAESGVRLTVDGVAEQGDSGGAAYVRWPDGRRGVLTEAYGSPARLRHVGEVLDLVRSRGIPVPRYLLVASVDGTTVVVQERVPGKPAGRIDRGTIDAVAELTDRFAGLLADRPDVANAVLHLGTGGREVCRHDTLAGHDARSRVLLARIRAVGGGDRVDGDDLVHLDFTPGNVLFDEYGVVTGVVDWHGVSGLARGDRRLGLVTYRFDLAWGAALDPEYPPVTPAAVERLDAVLEAMPARVLQRFWAYLSLRMVDWTIRHHGPADVDHQLAFAATRLG